MEDNAVVDWDRMPMEHRIDEHERMNSRPPKRWKAIVNASVTGDYEGLTVSQQLKSDLAWLNERLPSCHVERSKLTEYNQALGLIQAQISNSPISEWPALISRRNELQECCDRCNDASQFLANMRYRHPEFFQDYTPLVVIAQREQAAKAPEVEPEVKPAASVRDLLGKTKAAAI